LWVSTMERPGNMLTIRYIQGEYICAYKANTLDESVETERMWKLKQRHFIYVWTEEGGTR
jgi:hypothetical protein